MVFLLEQVRIQDIQVFAVPRDKNRARRDPGQKIIERLCESFIFQTLVQVKEILVLKFIRRKDFREISADKSDVPDGHCPGDLCRIKDEILVFFDAYDTELKIRKSGHVFGHIMDKSARATSKVHGI